MGNRVARWVALLPLVLVGSMMFWGVALGLGAASLMTVTGLTTDDDDSSMMEIEPMAPSAMEASPTEATAVEPVSGHADPITVHIEPSAEPEDVNDNAGAATPAP
jgi:hypothetical protein